MNQKFASEVLGRYVDGLRHGWSDAEECLTMFPARRAQLEPLFHIADLLVASMPPVYPSPTFAQRLKEELLHRAAARPESVALAPEPNREMWWRAAAAGSVVSVMAAVAVVWRNHSQQDRHRAA
jgi:hypothetical protein